MKRKLFLMAIMLLSFFSLGKTANAAESAKITYENTLGSYYHARYASGFFSRYGQMLKYKVSSGTYNGDYTYCIAPSEEQKQSLVYAGYTYSEADILDKVNSTQNENDNKLTKEQLNKISQYAFYGYGYQGHNDDKYYVATQMLIYRTIDSNQVFTNKLCSGGDCSRISDPSAIASAMQEIQALVDNHSKKPSFSGTTQDITIGQTIELTDTNNVLNEFKVSSCQNCTANIDGNKLSITATGIGGISITLAKGKDVYNRDLVFFTNSSSQNMVLPGNIDPVYATIGGTVSGGSVEVVKESEKGEKLSGAKFGVYRESDDHEVCTLTTGSGGTGRCENLPNDSYYLKEISAPTSYVLDTTKHYFTITNDNYDFSFEITNEKIMGFIEIHKVDKETNSAVAQGDALLSGAVYGIYDSHGTRVGELVTDERGYAKSGELEYGDYTIREESASEGYLIDGTGYNVSIRIDGETVSATSKEEVKKFKFSMLKTMGEAINGVVEAEPNAEFEVYLISSNKLMGTLKTDEFGKANITLPYGTYKVCQTKGNNLMGKAPCFKVELKTSDVDKIVRNISLEAKLRIFKVDSDTKESLPVAGIKFKIKNLDTNEYVCQVTDKKICIFETNEDGVLITPLPLVAGNYQLEELDQVVDGYLWNQEPLKFTIDGDANIIIDDLYGNILELEFENTPVKGKVELHKVGEKVVIKDGNFTYEEIPLSKIKFGLYDVEGNLVKEVYTNEDGYLEITDLKLGKYTLKELETLDGYVLDETVYEFELIYKDQYTPVIVKTFELKNFLKKGNLEFTKTDVATGETIPNTKIEVYTENDELIFSGVTDENGKITIKNLFAGKFYIVETEPATGYRLSDEKVMFEITKDGEVVKANMTNEKITSILKLHKVDEKGNPLVGVEFAIYDINDNLIGTYVTDENGDIELELEYGSYYWKEVKTNESYALMEEKIFFEVKEDGEVLEFSFSNEKIKSKVVLHKVDGENNPLAGVTFGLYDFNDNLIGTYVTDENGNIEIELEYGSYYWKELETLEGYELNDEKITFEIKENNGIIDKTIINNLIEIDVPITSSNSYYFVIPLVILTTGIGLYIYAKHKKNKRV